MTSTQSPAVTGPLCAGRPVVFGKIDVGTSELVDGKDVLYLSVTDEGPDSHERLHHDINPTKTNTSCDYWWFIQSAVVFLSIFSDSFLQSVFFVSRERRTLCQTFSLHIHLTPVFIYSSDCLLSVSGQASLLLLLIFKISYLMHATPPVHVCLCSNDVFC